MNEINKVTQSEINSVSLVKQEQVLKNMDTIESKINSKLQEIESLFSDKANAVN